MNSIQWETLFCHSEQWVAWITLNRPAAQNRVNLQMATELRDVCRRIGQDDGVRVVVVTGAGDTFCAGDENTSSILEPELSVGEIISYMELRRTAGILGGIEKPVVVAVNGDALGHGLEMALACDIRIAAANAQLGLPQITYGTMPWDGGTQLLPRVVGRACATDLLLTGRVIDSAEALRIGLVHQVTLPGELMARVEQLASTIAGLAPVAARYAKEAVLKGMDMTMAQGLRLEVDLNLLLQTTEDRAEGIASFLERRPPNYKEE